MDSYELGQNTNKLFSPPPVSLSGVLLLTAGHFYVEEFTASNKMPHTQVLNGL